MDSSGFVSSRRQVILSGQSVALMLGSGFSRLAGLVKPVRRIPYAELDGLSSVREAHAAPSCNATIGTIDGVQAIVYPSRLHLFEGYTPREVTSVVRHAHACGCGVAIMVGACGATEHVHENALGIVSDHINLTGQNPLVGQSRKGDVFLPMQGTYDPELRAVAQAVAHDNGVKIHEGIYAEVLGPSLETPAEVKALRMLGASYVGMSLALEAIMARSLGMRVLALALPTNPAGASWVSHSSVRLEATSFASELEIIVRGLLAHLGE